MKLLASKAPRHALPSHPRRAVWTFPSLLRTTLGKVVASGVATVVGITGVAVFSAAAVNAANANAVAQAPSGPNLNELAAQRNAAIAAQSDSIGQVKAEAAWEARQEQITSDADAVLAEAERQEKLSEFLWPTEGVVGKGNGFGMRYHPILHRMRLHDGVDIGAPCNQPIYAAQSGTVVRTTTGYSGGSGNSVKIDHGDYDGHDIQTAYLHMSKYVLAKGDTVEKGQLVGYVGSTGLSTGCHLHLALYVDGVGTDPMKYFIQPDYSTEK
ncbi:MAG: M23 family metallopeptidase [Propionibacteriaceae bacterium]|jgi:murein DD-endopeptidase MepM/ murein hydrolase activator NlpD|nr:M23 family metallopeptidase [Propionibacteriaceae bacterium]